ncbi:class I SAM-dependent methyltransferase [Agromyces silvae]|uniref:class I SAM-dependent methyltransferase n=1 Tax=Agromyces silvae TaxID=3388266 RepID=UPI00280B8324|nr:methyltransferase domain-containing protein [Agromyces protaetiae]
MGEETMGPDSADGSAVPSTAAAFTALDGPLWEPLGSAAVLRAQPQFDETVLDAWCGDGAASLPTAALVGPTGHVDAIDPDGTLVSIARERSEHLPQLQLHVADPAEWPTGEYDLVQCVLGLASCSTPDETARHLVALVKPGGRFVLSLWAQGALAPLTELAREALADLDVAPESEGAPEPEDDDEAAPSDQETDGPDEVEATDASDRSDESDDEDDNDNDNDNEDDHDEDEDDDDDGDGDDDDDQDDEDDDASDDQDATDASDVEAAADDEEAPGAAPAGAHAGGAAERAAADETSVDAALPGTAGTLATLLHDLGLVDVRAERVDRHLDLEGELAWQLVLGARLLPADALDALDEAARDRLRHRVLDGVAERGLTRIDASTLIAVGHRAG